MTPEAFHAAALALPGATMTIQWGDDHVYKVGGKMFAVLGGAVGAGGFSFKASDVAFEVLSETGRAMPAPYLARAKWLHIADLAAQDDDEVADWLKTAHGLIAAKLTRKARAEIGL
ncbi:MmcQ/YjbR family DNA-binding protein [Caulobacter sp. BK020]|uniref:MmcQ/YjbR family DNA-binding protein n=1 Tax=Caulobacter sp. BK020 TaxID=2512117 RepID=UPI0010428CB8|nr:MmcQ/YjbR family DNA-binding protein [Caulobacter sp. BK020]TCS16107.1 putative DNA-binding protein (MmcQ/YjbR family) [Caulobacter sp. BK020]